MSDAFRIFTHAISMVFRDLSATLRATYMGIALIAGSVILLVIAAPGSFTQLVMQDSTDVTNISNVGLVILAFFLMAVGYLTMVAAWHRFVLLPADRRDEGFTPGAGIVLGYLGRSLLLGILIGVLAIPVLIPVGLVAAGTGSDALAGLVAIPLFAVLGWVFFRLSLILPACTIGHNLTFRESWQATAPLVVTIFMLMIVMAIVDFALNIVMGALPLTSIIGGVVTVVISVLYALVSASILTTLYGIAIEGREI
ncbi:hypothetical protein [Tateyamaria sp. SN3-11]|uniref:hypothetical protein n=1 Tax=Tateyamaria sp. SN3-11 TaxID=3092147 RepID=UPI0039ED202E